MAQCSPGSIGTSFNAGVAISSESLPGLKCPSSVLYESHLICLIHAVSMNLGLERMEDISDETLSLGLQSGGSSR